MKLVGATDWFIRIPFMLEGLIQGFIGGVAACGGLWLINNRWTAGVERLPAEQRLRRARRRRRLTSARDADHRRHRHGRRRHRLRHRRLPLPRRVAPDPTPSCIWSVPALSANAPTRCRHRGERGGGRMGETVCRAVTIDPGAGAGRRRRSAHRRRRLEGVTIAGELKAFADAGAEVVVDFTVADAARLTVPWLAMHGIHAVVGTTGLTRTISPWPRSSARAARTASSRPTSPCRRC